MTDNLLQTKLYQPPLRPSLVHRPHLIEKLNRGLHGKLTLISAPAGFGKTTLISEWIAGCQRPFAWLSLDERDGELTRFLTYFVAALRTAAGEIGDRALAALQDSPPPAAESILTLLVNELVAASQEMVLVLDDYHVLESPPIDQALTFLLEHLPPQLHLVITTREDPPLPLPRLRARGWLTELRAADLRFTTEETAVFLHQAAGLDLSADELAALEKRTEGWIAGLQLAALSMQGRDDVPGFITSFAGDNRYILDYLVAEVLQRQPPPVRQFLVQTSILDRLCAPLCRAVTRQDASGDLLETLERGNLFVIPLDDRRQWYRYHHLFADVLQVHAQKELGDAVSDLHQRASRWYEAHDLLPDAVHHALAAGDFERVADLAERAWPAMDRRRESQVWLRWVQQLPPEWIRARPVLGASSAWALLDRGDLEAAAAHLQAVERWLAQETRPADEPKPFADEAQFQALPASVAAARTYLALARGDLSATQTYARQALKLIPEDDHLRRGTPAALLGLATWASGDLADAYSAFSEAMSSYQKAGNTLYAVTGAFVLADIRLAQGRLSEADQIYNRALAQAHEAGGVALRGTADLHLGLADLARERNDLAAAHDHVRESERLNEQALLPRWRQRWCLVRARLKEAQGDLDGALALLEEAGRHFVRGPVPDIRSLSALKARLWILKNNLAPALTWMREENLSPADELSYRREFDHLTLARLLIARGKMEGEERHIREALALLARLLAAAEAGGRRGSVLEILIQQALAHEAQGSTATALERLARALALAEPEGYVRTFVDEGPPVAALLKNIQAEGGRPPGISSQLLAAFAGQSPGEAAAVRPQPLVEPLSERELEVLQLVADGLTNRQIAERLYLALSTVKGHNRVIFGKLNAGRRTEAVARARELGIL